MKRTYHEAVHAMQAGVALWMNIDPGETSPKHLRVGVNAAMSDQAGLVRLLISKGLFTEEEYVAAITEEANREADRYEKRLSEHHGGANITLH